MQKLITAGAAVLLIGIGAFSTADSDAQRATRTTQGEIIEKDGKVRVVEKVVEPETVYLVEDVVTTNPAMPIQFMPLGGHPGTWQIVTHHDWVLLLNTSTGESFHLEDNDDGLFWKPIHRPGNERREMPRMPRERMDREDINPERLAQRIEELRKKAEKARGESLEKLERTIEELERMRKEREPRGDRDRERDRPEERERDRDREENRKDRANELEDVIHDLEEKIGDLKERWEESDSVREREKLEKAVNELKEEAERVRKELKELRR